MAVDPRLTEVVSQGFREMTDIDPAHPTTPPTQPKDADHS